MMVTAVIPAYKEADGIATTVHGAQRWCDNVIVVNRPSGDDTERRGRQAGAHVINVDEDGLGPAYLAAWNYIPSDDYVVHLDVGHDTGNIPWLLDEAQDGRRDVVIGSRLCRGGEHHGPWRRRLLSKTAAGLMNLTSVLQCSDWTSGLRVYSPRARDLLGTVTYTTVGHAWQIESLWHAHKFGLTVTEVPIVYNPSQSHASMRRVREAATLVWELAWE